VVGSSDRLECEFCGAEFKRHEGLISVADAMRLTKAIGHDFRVRILLSFGEYKEQSASDLSERLDLPIGTICHHLNALREAEPPFLLVTRKKHGRGSPQLFYEVNGGILGAG
jgi:predicted ArsR family transcriptional regulator